MTALPCLSVAMVVAYPLSRCVLLAPLTLALERSCLASQTRRRADINVLVPCCPSCVQHCALQVYKVCTEILGVAPSRCLVLEDAPAGVQAAKAAGCFTVAIPEPWMQCDEGEHAPVLASADLRLKSLEDFDDLNVFRKLFGFPPPLLLACGNSTVDVVCTVNRSQLDTFGLAPGTEAAGLSDSVKQALVDFASKQPDANVVAGGSAMNSVRVAAWSGGERLRTAFIGATAQDEHGKILQQSLLQQGVVPLLKKVSGSQTGVCGVLVDTETRDRTLSAVRGASALLDPSWMEAPSVKGMIRDASIIYITSFVLTSQPRIAAVETLIENGLGFGARLAVNLSSAGVVGRVQSTLEELLPKAHFIFGNQGELQAFGQLLGWSGSKAEMAVKLASMLTPGGLAVVTAGAGPTMVAKMDAEVQIFPVPTSRGQV